MHMKFIGIVVLLLALLTSGCGAEDSEKVIGVWRSAAREGSRYTFVEIAEDTITIGGKAGDVVLEDKDGKVSVRIAGRDDIIAVITIVDDKNITLEFSGMLGQTLKLVKSSKEEQAALENPPVENILGFWRSAGRDSVPGSVSIVEIAPDSITVDGKKQDVTITAVNGNYTLVSGEIKGFIRIDDDNAITMDFPRARDSFTRATPEEAAAIVAVEKEAMKQYFGVWRSDRPDHRSGDFEIVELGDSFITRNGQRVEATLDINEYGLNVTAGNSEANFRLQDSNTVVFRSGYDSMTMLRSAHEEIEKLRNPKIADFMGYWILEGDAPVYKTLAIGENVIYQDGFQRPFEVVVTDDKMLQLSLPGKDGSLLGKFTHAGTGRIKVSHFLIRRDSFYRRATQEEFNKMFEGMTDKFGVLAGYWRSAEPVTKEGGHATVLIEYNAQGKNGVTDRMIHFLLDDAERRSRNPKERILEGIMGYPEGNTSKPVAFLTEANAHIALADLTLQDANTVIIKRPNGKPLKLVRSNKEEMGRLQTR